MNWIKTVLRFLNLTNDDGKISITNISMLLVLLKGVATTFGMQDLVVFLGLLLNYIHKRYTTNKAVDATKNDNAILELNSTIDALKQDITTHKDQVQADVSAYKDSYEKVAKQAEEVKKLISDSNLSRAFNPRNKML